MKRILVAEDRPASLELIRTVLESAGYEVIDAMDGQDALHKAGANSVDLVLLDLQMPKIDGFGVIRQLRNDPKFNNIPIVALTASAMQGDRERALSAGFSSYIAKPINLAALRSEIERLLNAKGDSDAGNREIF
ncbi:MAG TPA: response regulator [Bryobacteraceae bacterium]|nr:response regulator [Bryobacteraceae bacterium]